MTIHKRLRIIIVRHGETNENVQGIIQGQLDTDLNQLGRQQAELTAKFLSSVRIHRAISSPLKRTADTARAIVEQQNLVRSKHDQLNLEFDSRIMERGFGVLEGKVYQGLRNKSEDTPGIEKMQKLIEKLGSFWNDLVVENIDSPRYSSAPLSNDNIQHSHHDQVTILIVSHGAAISALVHKVLLEGEYCIPAETIQLGRFWNCSITQVISPIIPDTRLNPTLSPGDLSRKSHWSIRPVHLGIHGIQKIRHLQSSIDLLAKGNQDPDHPDMVQLKQYVDKVTKEQQRDVQGVEMLRQDVIRGPDDLPVLEDIGQGPAISLLVQCSNIDHLAPLVGSSKSITKINVDELVGK